MPRIAWWIIIGLASLVWVGVMLLNRRMVARAEDTGDEVKREGFGSFIYYVVVDKILGSLFRFF